MRPTAAGADEAARLDLISAAADCIATNDHANTKVQPRSEGTEVFQPWLRATTIHMSRHPLGTEKRVQRRIAAGAGSGAVGVDAIR